jgi:histidine triad (HIT) family protein
MSSIFTRIIRGEIPSYKVAEDLLYVAFLDIAPIARGHVLVVPKLEVDKAFDLPKEMLEGWLSFAQPIAKAIEKAFPCDRCGVAILGIEVPHAHMHLVPINNADDLNFTRGKLSLSAEELEEIQQKIVDELNG